MNHLNTETTVASTLEGLFLSALNKTTPDGADRSVVLYELGQALASYCGTEEDASELVHHVLGGFSDGVWRGVAENYQQYQKGLKEVFGTL
ncbi:hypothetical protein UB46_17085 [Burkholderiaceae bacterium 16]|nr:hypothetical protein UB46_17085 [Burkholderiaceae bacterium 16]